MTSGVFTLPLFGIDTSSGDSSRVGDGSWGFIAGPENALLRGLVDAADLERPRFNPITLCGPTGVGKSHLLLGVLNQFRSRVSDRKCSYQTGADFARQYSRSIELDSVSDLRDKFAATRLLIVDGLDELSSKPAALNELLQIIDRSVERSTQLLFSCQASISHWTGMPAALRSRLEGGLIIPVAPPGEATRAEILRQLRAELGIQQTDGESIGERSVPVRATFRDLKRQVLQQATRPDAGGQNAVPHTSPTLAIRRISKTVARQFEIKHAELLGASRRKTVAQARGIAIFLARTQLGISFDQLGKFFGDRDHTTILHAYHKTAESIEKDLVLKQLVERLIEELAASS